MLEWLPQWLGRQVWPSLSKVRDTRLLFIHLCLVPTREGYAAGGMGAHMFGLLLFHPWLLTGSLVLFGVQLEPGDSLNITLNAAFPKGQDRTGQKGAPPTPRSQSLGSSRRTPSSVTLGTGKGPALPMGVFVPCYYV